MRILNLWTAIQHYPTLPFVVAGNFQKGMTTKVTSFDRHISSSNDGVLHEIRCTAAGCRAVALMASLSSLAREILPDVYYTPVLDGMKNRHGRPFAGTATPPRQRDRDLHEDAGLMPRHSRFRSGGASSWALGNPDSDITSRLPRDFYGGAVMSWSSSSDAR